MKKKIIYIDDEPINLELFKINFRDQYEVFITASPANGLEIIREEKIDVVITDYKMPVMNGMELIQKLKNADYRQTICMILSGYLETDVITDKSKIFKYIMKPYKKEEVIQHIEAAFALLANSA
jgi:two-component system, response regulator, stage 0 sporulation protein F